jgi:ribonuclease VapC
MIVDSSAVMAILREEPEAEPFLRLISKAVAKHLSAGTWFELAAVVSKDGDEAVAAALPILMQDLQIALAPVTIVQARIGHEAYHRFGKGRDKARLNFGDCFSYALAKETGLPLLFKGNDFAQTDIISAL